MQETTTFLLLTTGAAVLMYFLLHTVGMTSVGAAVLFGMVIALAVRFAAALVTQVDAQ